MDVDADVGAADPRGGVGPQCGQHRRRLRQPGVEWQHRVRDHAADQSHGAADGDEPDCKPDGAADCGDGGHLHGDGVRRFDTLSVQVAGCFDGSDWTVVQTWSASNTFTWTPSTSNAGYRVSVWVRNAGSTADAYDNNAKPSISFPISPMPPSAPVLLTAINANLIVAAAGRSIDHVHRVATGGSGNYSIKWWIFDGTSWSMATGWSGSKRSRGRLAHRARTTASASGFVTRRVRPMLTTTRHRMAASAS